MPIACIANQFFVFGNTDCGRLRQRNDDSFLINPRSGAVLLADGMGGHPDGDIASNLAVRTIDSLIEKYCPLSSTVPKSSLWRIFKRFKRTDQAESVSSPTTLALFIDVVKQANATLYQQNQLRGFAEGQGMGTTVVGCRVDADSRKLWIFHVGDSRLYLLRDGELKLLTKDHSAYQQWLDSDQTQNQPSNNILWQTLGVQALVEPDAQVIDILEGDRFLLCSDGLSNMVNTATLTEILLACRPDTLKQTLQHLIDCANEAGGRDNITAVIICS